MLATLAVVLQYRIGAEDVVAGLRAHGYAIVPIEPTDGMKGAGEMALIESGPSVNLAITAPLDAVLVWRAMVGAFKEPKP